jgi:GntR family transcriptional regulator
MPTAKMLFMIDRESGVPLYRQLADILRSRIDSGTYAPGKLLPSETHLQQEFELARDTVRAALDILRDEGRVRTYPGRGTSVVPKE